MHLQNIQVVTDGTGSSSDSNAKLMQSVVLQLHLRLVTKGVNYAALAVYTELAKANVKTSRRCFRL